MRDLGKTEMMRFSAVALVKYMAIYGFSSPGHSHCGHGLRRCRVSGSSNLPEIMPLPVAQPFWATCREQEACRIIL
jgi:hypothetical protein